MKKIETLWLYILNTAVTKKVFKHTQEELAQKFKYSLSTVNHALNKPTQIGAIRKESKFFVLADFDKLLFYWASVRNLQSQILYSTHVPEPIQEIEGLVPADSIYACYSAAKYILGEPPSDYSKVYIYLSEDNLGKVKNRFPENHKLPANLIAIKDRVNLKSYGSFTPLPLTFVDIWNLSDWYSHDFTNQLLEKIHDRILP